MNISHIAIATNNGDIGGGEVMLLSIARQLRSLGYSVTIVGPKTPSEVVEAATDEGFDVVALPAKNRQEYMAQLRLWDRQRRTGLLWCNGLVPSFATGGHKNRIVHLHQKPEGKLRWLVKPAQKRAAVSLVPSKFLAEKVAKTRVFSNWTEPINMPLQPRKQVSQLTVGFIGRPSTLKGTHLLAEALQQLNADSQKYCLKIAGEPKFIAQEDSEHVQKKLDSLRDAVQYLGWVEPAEFFKQIDVLVVPSTVQESFGLVAAEAMSARVPLIVSDAGALPEIVGANYPWIFKSGNSEALKNLLQQIDHEIREDTDLQQQTISQAYWRWLENYSPQTGKERLEALLQELQQK